MWGCSVVCPVYRVTGNEVHTARGKLHLTQVSDISGQGAVFEEIFSKCLLCGACSSVCPRTIDVCQEVVAARAAFPAVYGGHGYEKYLARKALAHPETLVAMRVLGRAGAELLTRYLPEKSGLRLRLALFQQDVMAKGTAAMARSLQTGLNRKATPLQALSFSPAARLATFFQKSLPPLLLLPLVFIVPCISRTPSPAVVLRPCRQEIGGRPGGAPARIWRRLIRAKAQSWFHAPPVMPICADIQSFLMMIWCGGIRRREWSPGWWSSVGFLPVNRCRVCRTSQATRKKCGSIIMTPVIFVLG